MGENLVYEAAKAYVAQGFSVIPINFGTKMPAISSWEQFQKRLPSETELRDWFQTSGPKNIAIITGKVSNIVVVDQDGPEGMRSAHKLGINSAYEAITPSGGKHAYFRHPGFEVRNTIKSLPGIDLRGDGGYVLAAPSVFNGKRYFWAKRGEMPVYVPLQQEKKILSPAPVYTAITQGERHKALVSLAGSMRRRGMEYASILAALRIENETKCQPPLGDYDVSHIADSVSKYQPCATNMSICSPVVQPETTTFSVKEIIAAPRSVTWVVDQRIPKESITIIGGMQGLGKTWLLLDLALELQVGKKWLGKHLTQVGKVLYIDEESSVSLLKSRLAKLLQQKKIQPEQVSGLSFEIGANFNLLQEPSVKKLTLMIERHKPDVVIVDSLVRVHGANENSSTEMAQFFGVIKRLIRSHGVTFIFADHENKGVYSAEARGAAPSSNDLRGSNEKGAAVDSVFNFRRTEEGLFLYHTKSRFATAAEPELIKIEDPTAGETIVRAY